MSTLTNTQRSVVAENSEQNRSTRKRSNTLVNLQWLAERLRKTETISTSLKAGTYNVDSKKVARAILNLDIPENS